MDAISAGGGGDVAGEVNLAMLKKTQDMVSAQVLDLVQSIPQSPNFGGVGANLDVTG